VRVGLSRKSSCGSGAIHCAGLVHSILPAAPHRGQQSASAKRRKTSGQRNSLRLPRTAVRRDFLPGQAVLEWTFRRGRVFHPDPIWPDCSSGGRGMPCSEIEIVKSSTATGDRPFALRAVEGALAPHGRAAATGRRCGRSCPSASCRGVAGDPELKIAPIDPEQPTSPDRVRISPLQYLQLIASPADKLVRSAAR
jgi:hypothetical protein